VTLFYRLSERDHRQLGKGAYREIEHSLSIIRLRDSRCMGELSTWRLTWIIAGAAGQHSHAWATGLLAIVIFPLDLKHYRPR
jgi:hypothetical protein